MGSELCTKCNKRPGIFQIIDIEKNQKMELCKACYKQPKLSPSLLIVSLLLFVIPGLIYLTVYFYSYIKWKHEYGIGENPRIEYKTQAEHNVVIQNKNEIAIIDNSKKGIIVRTYSKFKHWVRERVKKLHLND